MMVNAPVRAQLITVRNSKPAVIIPKAIAARLNLCEDWTAFNVYLVDGGLFLEIVDKRNER